VEDLVTMPVPARLTRTTTELAGVYEIERHPRGDERGSLTRLFCGEELRAAGWQRPVAQINHTRTTARGTIRGMHLQLAPCAEMKLVICIRGAIHDVAVDLRRDSATCLRHHAAILSADNRRALLIPEGCAHGFQALSDDVEIIYLHSHAHAPAAEAGISPFDPRIAVPWPMPVTSISARDAAYPALSADFSGFAP
jgi:dTDP-4-dehydrorhamnose 3,5-epimerase